MNPGNRKEEELNFVGVIQFIIRWYKPLAVVGIVAAVLAVILTMPAIMTPKFRSNVILYPTATSSISKAVISTNPVERADIMEFGADEQVDQLLQILQSDEITNHIREKFNLLEHYQIKPNEPYRYTKFLEKYNSNVKFRRTEFQSIEISVLDTDPQMAADIANNIAETLDSVKTRMQQRRARQGLAIVQAEFNQKKAVLETTLDSLQKLGRMGIMNYEEQAKILTEALLNAKRENRSATVTEVQEKLDLLATYGPVHHSLNEGMMYEIEELAKLRKKLEEVSVDAFEQVSNFFVVNYATPAERKHWPKRSMIVILAVFSSLAFTIIVLLGWENFLKIKGQLIESKPENNYPTGIDVDRKQERKRAEQEMDLLA